MMEDTFYIIVSSIILSLLLLSIIFYTHYQRVLRKNAYIDELEKRLHTLEKSISETTELLTLEPLLKSELIKIFGVKLAYLQMYSESENSGFFPFLREFFHGCLGERVFENSVEFINGIEDEALGEKLKKSLPEDIAYIFPIFSTQGFHIGNLILGEKISNEPYLSDEVEFLKEFSFFVEIHLKYIRTYTLMHELSKILDEKVDTKTIAYNNLLNRQKEFIKVISHEVRSPMTSAIFQVESVLEALQAKIFSKERVQSELQDLKDQLIRTGGLISKLFAVEYYDNNSVSLFREAIHFQKFLEYEIELFSRIHPDIAIISNIVPQIGFVTIDKVQFQQAISNLLDNAAKFANTDDPIIFISASLNEKKLQVTVEDNGKGLSEISKRYIFDKYSSSGSNKNIGLGLGLYLCKKIIILHNGTIEASNSQKYKGACFTISIPNQ